MKIIILLMLVMFAATTAYGEVYKWEDANGMHFTDNALSIPQKYREKVLGETRQDSRIQQSTQPTPLTPLTNNYPTGESRKPTAGNFIRSPQYPIAPMKQLHANTKFNEETVHRLGVFVGVVFLFGALLLLAWLFTLVDIIRSEFTDSSNKIIWFFLVLFLPLLGMILYQLLGTGQKKFLISPQERSQKESLTRLYPDKSKEGEFTIM